MVNAPINADGIALLEEFELFVDHAYPDPYSPLGKELQRRGQWQRYLKTAFPLGDEYKGLSGAPWTYGYGFTTGVKEGDTITQEQAQAQLCNELQGYADAVRKACTVAPNDNELAAMVCLAWNIGIPRFETSTVVKCHNRGDKAAAARAFGLWNMARGQVSEGLTRRRAAEKALYLKPDPQVAPEPMPQAVDSETHVATSPIVAATTGATLVSSLTIATQVSDQVKTIRENLGDWAPYGAIALVVVLGGSVIWQRLKQRFGGWA